MCVLVVASGLAVAISIKTKQKKNNIVISTYIRFVVTVSDNERNSSENACKDGINIVSIPCKKSKENE